MSLKWEQADQSSHPIFSRLELLEGSIGIITRLENKIAGLDEYTYLLCGLRRPLKGLPEVVGNPWPMTTVQTCIIH